MIQLQRLELKDFMALNEANINFISGTILITGENGTSKSAVVDAIAICLTEYRRADSYKDYIQLGKQHAFIKLWATVNSEPIFFNISINSEKANTFQRTITYQTKTYEMNDASELLKSLDLVYYGNIILSMQDSEDITKLSPTQRANYLSKLLNFDFSSQLRIIEAEIAELDNNKMLLQHKLEYAVQEEKKRLNEKKKSFPLPFEEKEYNNYKSKLEQIKTLYEAAHQNILKSSNIQNEKIELMKQTIDFEAALKIQTENENQNELIIKQKKELALRIEKNKIQIDILNTQIATKTTEKINLEKEHKGFIVTKASIDQNLIICDTELLNTNKKLDLCEQGICYICEQKIEFSEEQQKELSANKKLYESQKQTFLDDITMLNDKIDSVLKKIQTIQSDLIKLQRSIAIEEATLQTSEQQEKNLNSIELKPWSLETKNNLIISLDSVRSKINIIDKQLENSKEQNQLSSLKQQEADILKKISSYEEVFQQNLFIKQNNLEIDKILLTLDAENKERKDKIVLFNKDIALRKEAKEVFTKTLPNYMIIKTCSLLEQEMNNFIQIVFSNIMVKLYQSKKGVEFFYTTNKSSITDSTNKEQLLNVKMASGFQKELLSIAFRVALCKAYNLDLLILDECDKAASDSASEGLFEALLEDTFKQIVVITHKQSVKDLIIALAEQHKIYEPQNGVFVEIE